MLVGGPILTKPIGVVDMAKWRASKCLDKNTNPENMACYVSVGLPVCITYAPFLIYFATIHCHSKGLSIWPRWCLCCARTRRMPPGPKSTQHVEYEQQSYQSFRVSEIRGVLSVVVVVWSAVAILFHLRQEAPNVPHAFSEVSALSCEYVITHNAWTLPLDWIPANNGQLGLSNKEISRGLQMRQ